MYNFIVTDPKGNQYEVRGLTKFAIEHGLNFECLRSVATGKTRHHKGWKCVYADPVRREEAAKRMREHVKKRGWVILTPEGKKILTLNLLKFCKRNNLPYQNIRQSALSYKPYKGWRCFYASPEKQQMCKKVSNRWIVTRKGVERYITNLADFCRKHNLDYAKLKRNKLPGWSCINTRQLKLKPIKPVTKP